MIKKILISFISILVTLCLLFMVDRFIGWVKPKKEGVLPLPANTTLSFKTSEFKYIVSINSLGFRDREFNLSKSTRYRVIALGDSFTYGWGINVEQTWVKLLEKNLKNSQVDVEIANLGVPGASPTKYAKYAEKAIPALQPDLVVIGILQGDDLAQMRDDELPKRMTTKKTTNQWVNTIKFATIRIYPNLSGLKTPRQKQYKLKQTWKDQAQKTYSSFARDEKKRFDKLDTRVKQSFMDGDLNPSLMDIAIKRPSYYLDTLYLDDPKTRVLINKMAESLAYIKGVADNHKAKVVVVALPHPAYNSPAVFKNLKALGFTMDKNMLSSDAMDGAIRTACEQAQVSFYEFTHFFREKSRNNFQFYFEWDGHLNPAGHKFFADLLTPVIVKELKETNPGV